MRTVVFAILLAACKQSTTPNCERAVTHVFALTTQGPKPGADEQAMIDEIVKMTKQRCDEEGLSDAQRDCILAAKSLLEDRTFLMCPALVEKKPSWLVAPIGHPEAVDPPKPAK